MQNANNRERGKGREYLGIFCTFYSLSCKTEGVQKSKSINKQKKNLDIGNDDGYTKS